MLSSPGKDGIDHGYAPGDSFRPQSSDDPTWLTSQSISLFKITFTHLFYDMIETLFAKYASGHSGLDNEQTAQSIVVRPSRQAGFPVPKLDEDPGLAG